MNLKVKLQTIKYPPSRYKTKLKRRNIQNTQAAKDYHQSNQILKAKGVYQIGRQQFNKKVSQEKSHNFLKCRPLAKEICQDNSLRKVNLKVRNQI